MMMAIDCGGNSAVVSAFEFSDELNTLILHNL